MSERKKISKINLSFIVFIFALVVFQWGSAKADAIDGEWELRINGKDNLEFGTQFLAGGLTVKWTVSLLFRVKDGQYILGTGIAKLNSNVEPFSRPEKLFECDNIPGTYVSRNGQIFKTPHLRYLSFPVSGQVQLKKPNSPTMMKLVHGMEYPGNYYGVLFECKTKNDLGENWLVQSPRVSKEKASRQSIDTHEADGFYVAKIKQVKAVAPGPELMIPMIDQWQMTFSDSFGESSYHYQLIRQ